MDVENDFRTGDQGVALRAVKVHQPSDTNAPCGQLINNGLASRAVGAVKQHVKVFWRGFDPSQLGHVSDGHMRNAMYPLSGELLDVGLTVIPDRMAPEKVEKCRSDPRRAFEYLLEVVEDCVSRRLDFEEGQ